MLVILVICVSVDVSMVVHDACGCFWIMCLFCWLSTLIFDLVIDVFIWYIGVLHVLGQPDDCNVL